jgi:hypothetical protein
MEAMRARLEQRKAKSKELNSQKIQRQIKMASVARQKAEQR